MAITLNSSPSAYCPVYNPQWWVASSNQTAQPNFRYRVVLTDLISGATNISQDKDPDPDGLLVFDSSEFAMQYMTHPSPYGTYGFQLNTGAIRKVRVNIGEVYDVIGVPTYFAGSNTDYIVWNGSLDFLETQSYNYLDYLYSQSPPGQGNVQLITNMKSDDYTGVISPGMARYSNNENTIDKSSYLYCLSSANLDFQYITIVGFATNGTTIASTTIGNTNSSGTTYTNKYVYIDVGYKGLLNMPAGQVVSGTYPIPVDTYDYWEIYDTSAWIPFTGVPAGTNYWPLKRITKCCEPRFDVISLHYLSPQGSFETVLCQKLSLKKTQVNKTSYSKLPYYLTGSPGSKSVTFDYGSIIDNTLSSNERRLMTVNTDWLQEYEMEQYRDVFSSPIVYADLGDGNPWVSVKINDNSYEEKKKFNSSMLSIQFNFEYTHINSRQRG